jgi:hypothetical protein
MRRIPCRYWSALALERQSRPALSPAFQRAILGHSTRTAPTRSSPAPARRIGVTSIQAEVIEDERGAELRRHHQRRRRARAYSRERERRAGDDEHAVDAAEVHPPRRRRIAREAALRREPESPGDAGQHERVEEHGRREAAPSRERRVRRALHGGGASDEHGEDENDDLHRIQLRGGGLVCSRSRRKMRASTVRR